MNVPFTTKLFVAFTDAELTTVKLLNLRVPEFEIVDPLLTEIVPPEGLKFPPDPTLIALLILKLLDVVTTAEPAIVRLLKVSVPELLMDEP